MRPMQADYFKRCKDEIKNKEGDDEADGVVSVEHAINDKYH